MAARYELTSTLSKFLDRHLVFPLLEFLQERGIYKEEDLLESKIALLQHTNMVDFAMDIYQALHNTDEVPEEMRARRVQVVGRMKQLKADSANIIDCLSNQAVIRNFRPDKSWNCQFLQESFGIGPEQIEALYHFAKFQFDCGNYSGAAELLPHYRTLCTSTERNASALWGKLAADILMRNFDDALDDLNKVREAIDNQTFAPPLMQLQQRTWLMHWALFVFWNHENGRNALIDMFLQQMYLNAIQINAQHLLRYLAAAVVVNKRRRNVLKELVKLIQQESYEYSDPITEFLEALFVNYDFDEAQRKLKECEEVLENDFFLPAIRDEFIENARLFIFESYCRIHQCIDIKMLSEQLNMDQESAEKWVANLILNARLNAKIDSKAGTVIMGVQSTDIHGQLIDKAKRLSSNTFALANAVVGGARS